MAEQKKAAFDMGAFMAKALGSKEIQQMETKKISRFRGDITKSIRYATGSYSQRFIAPKEWTKENVEDLCHKFQLLDKEVKRFYKGVTISEIRQNRKSQRWFVDFETSESKEIMGTNKSPSLKELLKAIVVTPSDAGGMGYPELAENNTVFKMVTVGKVTMDFTDVESEEPLDIGKKGFLGLFLVSDLGFPFVETKSGKTFRNFVNGRFFFDVEKLPANLQIDSAWFRSGDNSITDIKASQFKLSEESITVKQMFKREMLAIALDIIDWKTVMVPEQRISKKKTVPAHEELMPVFGYHCCKIRFDKQHGFTVNNGNEWDGITEPTTVSNAVFAALNVALNQKKYFVFNDAGEKDWYPMADRVQVETNLNRISSLIHEAMADGDAAKIVDGDENCIYTRYVPFTKAYTLGDAMNEEQGDDDIPEGEEVEQETAEAEAPAEEEKKPVENGETIGSILKAKAEEAGAGEVVDE